MLRVAGVFAILLVVVAVGCATEAPSAGHAARYGWTVSARRESHGTEVVQATFLLHVRDAAGLKAALAAVSEPDSPRYGRHLTQAQVRELVAVPEAITDGWVSWAREFGVEATVSPFGDAVTLSAPVSVLEAMTGAAYAVLEQGSGPGKKTLFRPVGAGTIEFARLGAELAESLAFAIGVEDVEMAGSDARIMTDKDLVRGVAEITPPVIKAHYGVGNATGSGTFNNSQAVAEFEGQGYLPSDLAQYLSMFSLPPQKVERDLYFPPASPAPPLPPPGTEGSLDVDVIIGTGTGIPTTFEYTTEGSTFAELIYGWISGLVAASNPPLVNSVSYGLGNTHTPDSLKTRIDAEFQKAGSMGLTIIFSSGDHGSSCHLAPLPVEDVQYPAVSPYVLSVGATYLDGSSGQEIGATLSGGGFGRTEPMPSWQVDAVKAYLAAVPDKPESFEYNPTKRAIPDISAFGEAVTIVVNGQPQGVAGTSCSAPMSAAIFALVNGDRLAAGHPPLGFLPPFVYANGHAFNDITSGKNSDGLCRGWEAIKGFDLTTGWGSPSYTRIRDAAMAAVEDY